MSNKGAYKPVLMTPPEAQAERCSGGADHTGQWDRLPGAPDHRAELVSPAPARRLPALQRCRTDTDCAALTDPITCAALAAQQAPLESGDDAKDSKDIYGPHSLCRVLSA